MARNRSNVVDPVATEEAEAAGAPAPKKQGKKTLKPVPFEGGEILKSIFANGKAYNPGDEAAFDKVKPNKNSLQMLANKDAITGFGVEKEEIYDEEKSE